MRLKSHRSSLHLNHHAACAVAIEAGFQSAQSQHSSASAVQAGERSKAASVQRLRFNDEMWFHFSFSLAAQYFALSDPACAEYLKNYGTETIHSTVAIHGEYPLERQAPHLNVEQCRQHFYGLSKLHPRNYENGSWRDFIQSLCDIFRHRCALADRLYLNAAMQRFRNKEPYPMAVLSLAGRIDFLLFFRHGHDENISK